MSPTSATVRPHASHHSHPKLTPPDLHDASQILSRALATLPFLPPSHLAAFDVYVRSLQPSQSAPHTIFFSTLLALFANVEAILRALARPPQTIAKITAVRREAERNYSSLNRSSRWPLGLLDETRLRLNEEREEKARRGERDAQRLARELRYTQQTVAGELAGWRDVHERMGRRAIREYARGMLTAERMRLEGMHRALRRVRGVSPPGGRRGGGDGAGVPMASPGLGKMGAGEGDGDDDGLFGEGGGRA